MNKVKITSYRGDTKIVVEFEVTDWDFKKDLRKVVDRVVGEISHQDSVDKVVYDNDEVYNNDYYHHLAVLNAYLDADISFRVNSDNAERVLFSMEWLENHTLYDVPEMLHRAGITKENILDWSLTF